MSLCRNKRANIDLRDSHQKIFKYRLLLIFEIPIALSLARQIRAFCAYLSADIHTQKKGVSEESVVTSRMDFFDHFFLYVDARPSLFGVHAEIYCIRRILTTSRICATVMYETGEICSE